MWQRLGKDDFEKANELRKGFGSDIWEWGVCSEYELREVEEDGRLIPYLIPKYSSAPLVLGGNEDKWTLYNPLEDTPDLFLRFARLYDRGDSIEPIIDWVHRYGVLGHGSGGHRATPQSVEDFKRAVRDAAGTLAMYEAVLNGDGERAKFLILEEFPFLGQFFRLTNSLPQADTPRGRELVAAVFSELVEEHYSGDYLQYALSSVVY